MTTRQVANLNIFDSIRENWTIIVFIVAIIIGWAGIQTDIAYLKESVKNNNIQISTIKGENNTIRESLATIKEQVSNTREGITDLKKTLEKIEERLSVQK